MMVKKERRRTSKKFRLNKGKAAPITEVRSQTNVLANNTWEELKVTNKAEGSRFSVL